MRLWRIDAWKSHPVDSQREVLQDLVTSAQYTEFGRKYNFSRLFNVRDFKQSVPIHEYDDIKPYIQRIMDGEQNILWNTPVSWFAKSSGTTSDKSKFIPVSDESLQDCHYQAAKDVLTFYYNFNPDSDLLTGKGLVIGGSHNIHQVNEEAHYGDLSAVLLQNSPFWGHWIRTPELSIALMDEWESKIEMLAKTTIKEMLLPPLFQSRRPGGDRDRDLDLAAHQPDQPARKHPADAPARRPDPEEGREPPGAGSGAEEAVGSFCLGVIFSENRLPLFGIMRYAASVVARPLRTSASRSRSSGFTRKSSMPAARQASRSSPNALAVSAMIGVRGRPLAASAARMRRVASMPSSCGMCTSISTRSYGVPSLPPRGTLRPRRRRPARRSPVAEPGEQRAGEQRVDLVVLRDQDREACASRGFRALARRRSIHAESSPSAKRAASEAARTGLTR